MTEGWRYRGAAVLGTAFLTAAAVFAANLPPVLAVVDLLPVLGGLPRDVANGGELAFEVATATVVVVAALVPLYKPRPRRILDISMQATRRTALALLALATIGYFDYTYRLPRLTLIVAGGYLLVTIPVWFVAIRRRPHESGNRVVIVGDDPDTMADILQDVEGVVVGYVSPPSAYFGDDVPHTQVPEYTDGGNPDTLDELTCLSGLSRLDEVLVEHDIDVAVLAFARPDREEFFGALDTCYDAGVAAKVHRDHADVVLTQGTPTGELVDIDLEPWDPQDHVAKRIFDLAFSISGLLVLSPVILTIAAAIKIEDGGPILYSQQRTASFGDTFTIYKFRSMVPDAESESGATLSDEDAGGIDPRVTRVGRFLRQTHLDEIPQLWSILVGDMSVVGPRPERPELDADMEAGAEQWRSRWFVKPGLTGLAQVQGATGYDPAEKLRYDIEYIRQQSFWFDVKIVIRQIWHVLTDVSDTVRR